ncbi:MAG TPA: menaquinone biosynthesis decarboxylase [Spirochaetota bacterium]|nr:menaquinone biosynthesis decarboxylase [Spirochaetota bacterium]
MKKNYRNIHEFIDELEKEGELIRFREPVSSRLEITEITDRMSKLPGGGKAILFENVKNSEFPVLMNQFGSIKRINMALGSESLDELAGRLQAIINMKPPKSLMDKVKLIPELIKYSRFLPRSYNGKAPCQDVILKGDKVDLTKLPVLFCWPDDGGPFVTLPVVFTKGLTDGKRNAGMYRMQIFDRNTTGMHWHIHKDGAHHFNEYLKAGKRMEVAVAIGTDPAVTYSATAPMPRGIDEMLLAGFIRRAPVRMAKCVTVDLEVPAEAEFIIEGYVDPGELKIEGPFGDHTGYYSLKGDYPVFHVTAITHRKNAVYSATIVGKPPMEDCFMALATERLFLPMIKTVLPEIKDYMLPWEGVFHNIAVVSIDKEFPHHAGKVMNGMWGSGQMSFAKILVMIDDEKLLYDRKKLIRHILDTIDLQDDVTLTKGILDVLDHSAEKPLYGSKLGIDATARISGEEPRSGDAIHGSMNSAMLAHEFSRLDPDFTGAASVLDECRNRVVLLNTNKGHGKNSSFFINRIKNSSLKNQGIFVMLDSGIELSNYSIILWKVFNNVDPSRDMVFEKDCIIIDATKKGIADGHSREWPDDIEMSEDVKKKIDEMLTGHPEFLKET